MSCSLWGNSLLIWGPWVRLFLVAKFSWSLCSGCHSIFVLLFLGGYRFIANPFLQSHLRILKSHLGDLVQHPLCFLWNHIVLLQVPFRWEEHFGFFKVLKWLGIWVRGGFTDPGSRTALMFLRLAVIQQIYKKKLLRSELCCWWPSSDWRKELMTGCLLGWGGRRGRWKCGLGRAWTSLWGDEHSLHPDLLPTKGAKTAG